MDDRIDFEAKTLEASREVTRKRLAESNRKNVLQWEIDNLSLADYVAEEQDDSFYVVPATWEIFVGKELVSEMN
jgi:hypothetical protein